MDVIHYGVLKPERCKRNILHRKIALHNKHIVVTSCLENSMIIGGNRDALTIPNPEAA